MSLQELEAADWDALLSDLGLTDVYLGSAYVESASLLDSGRPVFLQLDGVAFAAILREIAGDRALDVTTPYGYGGPVAHGPDASRFWDPYEAWCAERDVVTSFFRFHPLYANHRYAGPRVLLEALAGTVAWRLGVDDLFGVMHRSHRNKCRKAERAGVAVTVALEPADLIEFTALYEQTMRRLQAADFYFFQAEYWQALASTLRSSLIRFDARLEGDLLASAICLASKPWLHYHLGATTERARQVGASNLLLYEAGRWAKDNGFELFHLGGGVGGRDDSLLGFKRGFDPGGLRECWIGKAVHNEEAYRALTGGARLKLEGFFPAYRVPGGLSQTAGAPDQRQRIRPATVADVTAR
jgi:serine/alanine adding enzyme